MGTANEKSWIIANTIKRLPKDHFLKLVVKYFDDVDSGKKTFELRNNDRDYQVGDRLILLEWDWMEEKYTERMTVKKVTYILHDDEFLRTGIVCLGIQPIQ